MIGSMGGGGRRGLAATGGLGESVGLCIEELDGEGYVGMGVVGLDGGVGLAARRGFIGSE